MNIYRFTWKIAVIAGMLLSSTVARAIPIVDTVNQNVFMDTGSIHSYTHNLLDDGFQLGTATSGAIEIQFFDDDFDSDFFGANWEVILIVVDDFDFDTGGLSTSTSATSFSSDIEFNALAEINSAGMLDITIASLWGDFYVGQSILTVETSNVLESDVRSVPEPGVLGMLGIGLIGIGVARRYAKT